MKNYGVYKVEYVEKDLTLREAMNFKRRLNSQRDSTQQAKFFFEVRKTNWSTNL